MSEENFYHVSVKNVSLVLIYKNMIITEVHRSIPFSNFDLQLLYIVQLVVLSSSNQ